MQNSKILIIDDDLDLTEALQATLESQEYAVDTAVNRTEGMEKIKTGKPDLVILDVMMSTWHDGFEMARELKQDPEFKNMPIVMLTGIKDKSGIEFKSEAGDETWLPVDEFLDKPVEPEVLLEKVKTLLSKAS
jgi:DNA-binding response OmpR family regulator